MSGSSPAPAVDAWQARFTRTDRPVGCSWIGTQSLDPHQAARAIDRLVAVLPAAMSFERVRFADSAGHANACLILYWDDPEQRARFWATDGPARWWDDGLAGRLGTGMFREEFEAVPSRLETLFSVPATRGFGDFGCPLGAPTPDHGFWGGSRRRIAASASDTLAAIGGAELSAEQSGRHLVVTPHGNLCLIRSGQDLEACRGEERALYDETVLPRLRDGIAYLDRNGREANCLFARLADEIAPVGGPLDRTCAFAAFRSLADLEAWASSHPSHTAIFGAFMTLATERRGDVRLSLWHEVCVIAAGDARFEYVDCHDRTGLLAPAVMVG